ncbi:hypothetical protein Syun_010026 [Stephania yunnanensis]|uniref:Uncharacterized protein n=1 Tax=Stephania yunnanensis TaxID=152371 RepID=A0AAP0PPM3_9MAGN
MYMRCPAWCSYTSTLEVPRHHSSMDLFTVFYIHAFLDSFRSLLHEFDCFGYLELLFWIL